MIKKYILLYTLLVPVFFAIDLVWLGVIATDLYNDQLGYLLAEQVNWIAALIFYSLYIVGIVYFAVLPGSNQKSPRRSVINGALFGFLAYATYDLTNLATIQGWPLQIVLIDIVWGAVLTGTVAWCGWHIARKVVKLG